MDAIINVSAHTAVATAPSPATSGLSLVVTGGVGAVMPATPFMGLVWPTASKPTVSNSELVMVTSRATDTLTLVRAQQGTTARPIVIGDQFAPVLTHQAAQAPTVSLVSIGTEVIQANASRYCCDRYEVQNGHSLELLSGGILEVG